MAVHLEAVVVVLTVKVVETLLDVELVAADVYDGAALLLVVYTVVLVPVESAAGVELVDFEVEVT